MSVRPSMHFSFFLPSCFLPCLLTINHWHLHIMSIFLSHRPILHLLFSTLPIISLLFWYHITKSTLVLPPHLFSLSFFLFLSLIIFLFYIILLLFFLFLFFLFLFLFFLFFRLLCFEQHDTDSFTKNILLTFSSSAEANFLNRSWVCALWGLYNQYYKNIGKWNEINWTKNLSFQMWMNYWMLTEIYILLEIDKLS